MEAPSRPVPSDRAFYLFNAVLSITALAVLFYILVIRRGGNDAGWDLRFMPAVNAGFNTLAATFLTIGFLAIRRKAVMIHKYCMVSAFAASTLFLVGYLAYHYVHGDTRYVGPMRGLYLVILATHVLLSMTILPLALATFYFAFRRSFARHAKVARITLPIWLYVSVTGVVIFFMLRGSQPALP